MIKLYDNAFSPFARKVRMVLEFKGLDFDSVDGLLKTNHDALKAVNGRIEVPALTDDEIVVVNSADIVAYLELRYPTKPVYPESSAARVHARGWERAADTFIDPIWSISRIGNGLTDRTKCRKVCSSRLAPISGSCMTRSTASSLIGNL